MKVVHYENSNMQVNNEDIFEEKGVMNIIQPSLPLATNSAENLYYENRLRFPKQGDLMTIQIIRGGR